MPLWNSKSIGTEKPLEDRKEHKNVNPTEKLPLIQWLPAGTAPLSKFQVWYHQRKQAFNAQRAYRYKTDPVYREKILARKQAQTEKKAQQRQYRETVFGQVVRAYSIGEAALFIRRRAQTITQWERRGFIPPTIFPPPRSYTHHQVMLLRELVYIVTKAYARRVSNGKVKAPLEAQRVKIFAQWNEIPDSVKS